MSIVKSVAFALRCAAIIGLGTWLANGSGGKEYGYAALVSAQEAKPTVVAAKPETPPPTIAEEPKSIDSAQLVDPKLRQNVTVTFDEASLSEVAAWLRKQTGFNVSLDTRSLGTIGIDANSPISDKLQDAPVYLLLDRLERHKIAWRLNGGVLLLHAVEDDMAPYNVQYNVGDLLDQGFKPGDLANVLKETLEPSDWKDTGNGPGDLVQLGDVMFIRHTNRVHRRVAGLLAGLRKPARRVLVDDSALHAPLRAALDRPTSVAFTSKPLGAVIDELAKKAAIDLRLDRVALRDRKTTERTPVTFELSDQSLRTTLDLLLAPLELSWILRNGAIWVTSAQAAGQFQKTAVFDVRDLCPDDETSEALSDAITRQTDPNSWISNSGFGAVEFAKPGVMVVTQTERRLDAIQGLLENYRIALRNSKRRISPDEDPEVVEIKYYRMPTEVAVDLEKNLPTLLFPDSWKSPQQGNAIGTIRRLRSWDEAGKEDGSKTGAGPHPVSYSILVIEQKRKVHREIPKILQRLKNGDEPLGFGGMGGMGGMGGGFF